MTKATTLNQNIITTSVFLFISALLFAYNAVDKFFQDNNFSLLMLFLYVLLGMIISTIALNLIFKKFNTNTPPIDLFGGIVAPLFCLRYDPLILKNGGFLSSVSIYIYWLTIVGILVLIIQFMRTFKSHFINAILAGVLLAGALFALILGVILLPFSIVGLIFLIGIFGFVPFLSSNVFYRYGIKRLRIAQGHLNQLQMVEALVPGAVIVILLIVMLFRVLINFFMRQ